MAERSSEQLKARWGAFRKEHPNVRIRDAAEQLETSEAQLVATACGETAVRLTGPWPALVEHLEMLGEVMALTRNDHAVHEKTGRYRNVRVFGSMGLVLDEAIDLRLFFSNWHIGFAVEEETASGIRHSLQFFNASGTAVHKVYLTGASDHGAYGRLIEQYRHPDQSMHQAVLPVPPKRAEAPDAAIDVAGLLSRWRVLQDTHDFKDLLDKYGVGRKQALRLATPEFCHEVMAETALRSVLIGAAQRQVPIMVFVGSPGVIQIHSGTVDKLMEAGPWYNVLDADFNLHLRESAVTSAWVVRKPTVDGDVTALELFDEHDRVVAQLFGQRKPGMQESLAWRELIDGLQLLEQAA